MPYVKPGFDLAVECRRRWLAAARDGFAPRGMILLNHGVFTFDDDPRASYERMLAAVAAAAAELPDPRAARAPPLPAAGAPRPPMPPGRRPRSPACAPSCRASPGTR